MVRDREEEEKRLNVDAVRGDLRAAVRELRSAAERIERLGDLIVEELGNGSEGDGQ